jgi:hypothetical protein
MSQPSLNEQVAAACGYDYVQPEDGVVAAGVDNMDYLVRSPDRNIADAFDVLDAFCAAHKLFEILTRTGDSFWRCEILGTGENCNLRAQACDTTRPLAICRAIVAAQETLTCKPGR